MWRFFSRKQYTSVCILRSARTYSTCDPSGESGGLVSDWSDFSIGLELATTRQARASLFTLGQARHVYSAASQLDRGLVVLDSASETTVVSVGWEDHFAGECEIRFGLNCCYIPENGDFQFGNISPSGFRSTLEISGYDSAAAHHLISFSASWTVPDASELPTVGFHEIGLR